MSDSITSMPLDFVPTGEGAPKSEAPPGIAPAPGAPPAEVPPAPAEAPTETDPFDTAPDDAKFDKPYVTKLREEAAARRLEAKKYKDVFEGYNEEDQQVWFDIATAWRESPAKAAEMMEQIAAAVRNQTPAEPVVESEPVPAGDQPLTVEQVKAMITSSRAEWEAEQAAQTRTLELVSQAETLGYKRGTPGYRDLFARAQFDHAGDLQAAHAAVEAERQAIRDEVLQKKGATAGPIPVNQGAAPGTRVQPKSWKEISAVMRAAEDAQVGR